jgi:hypothetical protein
MQKVCPKKPKLEWYISVDNFPHKMDEIPDPKQFLIAKAKKSRKRNLKKDIVPRAGSTAKIGPNYNACLSNFIRSNLNVHRAIKYSESLDRGFRKIQNFSHIS